MKIPYRLRRRPIADEAEALLLEGQDTGRLLRLCEQLGGGSWPRVLAVASGFLVLPDGPTPRVCPGAIRLRRLAENLYLPTDAELSPALLDDEAEGLTRQRGLIFLPGGRVLAFDPKRPLRPSAVLSGGPVARNPWSPLPDRPPRADRIKEILLEPADTPPEEILDSGGEGIGTETPPIEDPKNSSRVLGGAALGAGKGMMWLGQAMGLKGLSAMGARWVRSALEMAPKLTGTVLGQQEAALRNLLREFREGDIEKALRRALPLGRGHERGARAHTGSELPNTGDFRYSLSSLLGDGDGGGGGGARYWFGGFDVQAELAQEYRKAAEAAARRGDYRRSAFIYGRLLQDYSLAAGVLLRGGLAHDAAILYLEKLNDPIASARAFEAAGEVDRALQLYRSRGEHVRAGDLLGRLGEHEAALQEYLDAAEALAEAPGGHLRAGELILSKVRRPDLARRFFVEGWALRPRANATPCALQLARIAAADGEGPRLLDLLTEAEAYFEPPGQDRDAALLFNEVARLAEEPALATVRDDLRDRALMALAAKLRQQARVGSLPKGTVSTLLGPPWQSNLALLRDAEFAVEVHGRGPSVAPVGGPSVVRPRSTSLQIGAGVVTAFAYARKVEELFLGFRGGEVYRFRPACGSVELVAIYALPVSGLTVDSSGTTLVVLWGGEAPRRVLAAYARRPDGTFHDGMTEGRAEAGRGRPWLSPIVFHDGEPVVGAWDGLRFQLLRGPSLVPTLSIEPHDDEAPWCSTLLLPGFGLRAGLFAIHLYEDGRWCWGDLQGVLETCRTVGWSPQLGENNSLIAPPLSWCVPAPGRLEVAGLGPGSNLYRSVLERREDELELLTTNLSAADEVYLATALLRSGVLAGVTFRSIHWLRGVSNRFSRLSTTEIAIPNAIACAPSRRTNELIVVSRDGAVERVPLPNH